MRQFLQRLWVAVLRASGALWWAKCQLRREGAIVVLLLHRVLDEAEWRGTHSLPSTVLRSRTFGDLAEYLARRCRAVRLSDAAPGTVGRKIAVAVTFDDAWSDNCTIALPVAEACGVPATVFVCTGLAGCVAPFWPERVAAALRAMRPSTPEAATETLIEHLKSYTPRDRAQWLEDLAHTLGAEEVRGEPFEGDSTMTWEEIAEMDRAGVAFGSHTHTHQALPAVGAGVARREVRDSQAALERRLGKRCDLFAYPHGRWSPEARQMLEEEGFRLAFTTERNAWTADCDPLLIPRANICENGIVGLRGRFSPAMFEYTAFWKVWRAMRAKARPQAPAERRPEERAAA
jgi:peptidoglycan/xylan/chitin deacetylase (PgdA/CDA1 family)